LFGRALAVADGRVLVGAPDADGAVADAGAAFLFDAATGTLLQSFHDPSPTSGDAFGHAVAILPPFRVVVGAPFDDTFGVNAGAAYVFHAPSGALLASLRKAVPGADDQLGRALTVRNGRAIVAAPFDDTGAPDTGAAYELLD